MVEVRYTVPSIFRDPVEVRSRLVRADEATISLGHRLIKLRNKALSRQLERDIGRSGYIYDNKKRSGLPSGTVERAYNPLDRRQCVEVAAEIIDTVSNGGVEAIISDGPSVVAHARVSRISNKNKDSADMHIREVLTASPRRHLGSVVLHAALLSLDNGAVDRFVFDGLRHNSTNKWFEKMGFTPTREPIENVRIGECQLPALRYVFTSDDATEDLLENMEMRWPWLRSAQID